MFYSCFRSLHFTDSLGKDIENTSPTLNYASENYYQNPSTNLYGQQFLIKQGLLQQFIFTNF